MKAIHYAGKMRVQLKRSFQVILSGWAACCSGEKAEKIRAGGNNTYDRNKVTCKACLRKMAYEKLPEQTHA